jgi:predicted dehydrogenase
MDEALPIAIAGAGLMGSWHAHYARQCGAEVCGILDHNRDSAERLAAKFPGASTCNDLSDLLHHCRPRVIHIATPLASHAPMIEAAMAAGANVLVEKPLACDSTISRDLLTLAERKGLLLAPTHQFLFQRGFLQARDEARRLGRILHLDATFCSAGGEQARGTPLDEIVGAILPHPLALIECLLPGSLQRIGWSVTRPIEGEWRIAGGTDGNMSVSILMSMHGRPTAASFRIVTDGGVIEVDLFHGFATIDTAAVSRATKIARPFRTAFRQFRSAGWNLGRRFAAGEFAYPGLRTLISEFYAAVRTGAPSPISPGETLAVALARDAVLRAAERDPPKGAA